MALGAPIGLNYSKLNYTAMKHFNLLKSLLLLCALIVGSLSGWAEPTTYTFSSIPTTGWSTSGGSQTINGKSWNYSSSTYIGASSSRIQIGSKNSPQTSAWTIQTPVSSFGTGKAIKSVAITAYTTAASASYDISVGGASVKSGSLTTSSSTYTADGLTVTTGNIVITMTGSSTSKAMYLSNISVTYDDATSDPVISASNNINIDYNATSGEFAYSITNPVDEQTLSASITSGETWLSNATVDANNNKVTFTTTENEDEDNARVGTIRLVYGNNLATKDVTITQTAAPKKYTVTFSNPIGGTLVIKNGDINISSGTRLPDGTVLTIVPTADANYKYKNWQYKKGTNSWTTKTTTYDYTMDENDVEFKANFEPTYTVNWSVNGSIASTTRFAEGDDITFPDNPDEIDSRVFVGWVSETISGTTNDEPSFITSSKMGTNDLTFYAVFATAGATGAPVETKTQTLQYDTWSYSNGTGSTKDKSSYRLFGEGSYIESSSFDLSKLSKVIVYGGTFGGASNNSLTIGDGVNTWKDVTVTGSENNTPFTITDGNALSGTKKLRITSNSGNGNDKGVRISKVEIFTNEASVSYSDYCTTVATDTREAVNITSFNAIETTLIKGNTTTTSVANDQAGWTAAYTYASDNTDVATVAADGVITAVGKGTANITATLNVDKDDANYKKGTIFNKSIEITVNNPSHTVAFYDNGTKINETSVEEETAIVFPSNPTSAVGGFVFEGWATAAIDGTAAVKPATVTEANMGDADINYYAVYVEKRILTAVFNASDITKTPAVTNQDLTWKDTATDITLKLSAGQRYTNGAPNTWSVTKGTSNYFEVITPGVLTSVVATISGSDYKIKSVSAGTLTTNGTTQTIASFDNASSVKCYATSNYQIRATEIVVNAESEPNGYVTTLPTDVTVSISSAGWATYSSNYPLDFTGVTALTAYTASKDGDVVKFNKVTGKVPANTGLLVKGETANVPVCASAEAVSNLLVGVTTDTPKDAGTIFVLMKGSKGIGFYKNTNDFTLRANSAYLPAEAVPTTDARAFIALDDETTGIADVKAVKEDAEGMFDLQGRKVAKPTKGLYIVNGKKVVVK